MAASKTWSAEVVDQAIAAGCLLIGENRVQEAAAKLPLLSGSVEKHLIGPLQTNKVNKALSLFDCIQSVDSIKLARKIDLAAAQLERRIKCLIEVRLEFEPDKHGVDLGMIRPFLEEISTLNNLDIQGLMAIPPFADNAESVRPYFRLLRTLYDNIEAWELPNVEMNILSMGMSHDYEVAIEEGANLIRIGRALFGER